MFQIGCIEPANTWSTDSNIVASEKYEYPKHDTTDGRGRTEAAQTQRTPSPGHRIGCVEKTAYDEEQSFPSMRSRRLARMQGEVGSDDKPKGVVRYAQDMTLEFWLSDRKQQNGTWSKSDHSRIILLLKKVADFDSPSCVP